jgi:hypothetical protein
MFQLPAFLVAVCGLLTGALTMLLYARVSPQERLSVLSQRVTAARSELNQFDGADGQVMWNLARRALLLSLQQVSLTFVPTLLAMVPVLVIAACLEHWLRLSEWALWNCGPPWLATGYTAFWLPLCVTALIVKWKLKIT